MGDPACAPGGWCPLCNEVESEPEEELEEEEPAEPVNQCMGCQAGWPFYINFANYTAGRTHLVVGGYPHEVVGCTADRYAATAGAKP